MFKRKLAASLFLTALLFASAAAQTDTASNSNSNTAPSPLPTPTPIPVASVLSEADAVSGRLRSIRDSLNNNSPSSSIESGLPQIRQEIDSTESNARDSLNSGPSLDDLRSLEENWRPISQKLAQWTKDLQARTAERERALSELNSFADTWKKTLAALQGRSATENNTVSPGSVPSEVVHKVNEVINDVAETTLLVETDQKRLLSLQTRVSSLQTRVEASIADISSARDRTLANIFLRDDKPVWQVLSGWLAGTDAATQTFAGQQTELQTYATSRTGRFILHGTLFLVIISLLFWARNAIKPYLEKEPKLEATAQIFAMPVITALVLAMLLSGWFYPQAPPMLRSLIGMAGVIPAVILLRRLVGRSFHILLNALVLFFLTDRIRDLFPDHSTAVRLIFIAEITAAILFLFWFLRSKKLAAKVEASQISTINSIKRAVPFLMGVFGIALTAQILGFVSLANLIGNGILTSSYAALIIYAAVRIIQGILVFALRIPPLSKTSIVKNNRPAIRQTLFSLTRWIGIIAWLFVALNVFSVRNYLFTQLGGLASLSFSIGSVNISIGDILVFLITLWIAVLISRFLRFILAEDLYPRWDVGAGASYAISTTLHYAVIVIGFLIAVGALGVDFTKFAIVAGAIGVGIGFGLQTIINNFVSGLILLFERPIKVGDTIQINEHTGSLKEIGLRASVLRKVDGSDVIVPNSMLVSEQVVNWTLSDTKRRIDIPVGVSYGSNPQDVSEILNRIASGKEDILKEPAPRVLFSNLGESSIDFELRVWVDDPDKILALRSEMVTEIYSSLNEAGIELPFPQRDVHIRSMDDSIVSDIKSKK